MRVRIHNRIRYDVGNDLRSLSADSVSGPTVYRGYCLDRWTHAPTGGYTVAVVRDDIFEI